MTKVEIVTALRSCAGICSECVDCILYERDRCTSELKTAAADLIENQQREIEALRQANRALRERQKWIPVAERLPEAPKKED